jgi:hypothetical protein
MKAFLKDNIALVAAIALPLFLAAIFAVSTLATRVTVEDPKNDFFIATDYYDNNSRFQFDVNNERLNINYRKAEKDANGYPMYNGQKPRLWRVNVPEMTVQEISLNAPGGDGGQTINIPGVTDIKITNLSPGPDGYQFVDTYNHGGNIMTEIFSVDGPSRQKSGISKDGRIVTFTIPDGNRYNYYNTRFLGWVTE